MKELSVSLLGVYHGNRPAAVDERCCRVQDASGARNIRVLAPGTEEGEADHLVGAVEGNTEVGEGGRPKSSCISTSSWSARRA